MRHWLLAVLLLAGCENLKDRRIWSGIIQLRPELIATCVYDEFSKIELMQVDLIRLPEQSNFEVSVRTRDYGVTLLEVRFAPFRNWTRYDFRQRGSLFDPEPYTEQYLFPAIRACTKRLGQG